MDLGYDQARSFRRLTLADNTPVHRRVSSVGLVDKRPRRRTGKCKSLIGTCTFGEEAQVDCNSGGSQCSDVGVQCNLYEAPPAFGAISAPAGGEKVEEIVVRSGDEQVYDDCGTSVLEHHSLTSQPHCSREYGG